MNKKQTKTITQSNSSCLIWPSNAAKKIGEMVSENNQANAIINKISSTTQNSAIKGGFAAETYHAESFNLDAILKDADVRAFTDNFSNSPLQRNDQINDIVVVKGGKQILGAQLKYFKNADATQKAFRSSKDGIHRYEKSDLFIGPSNQIEGIKESANKTILKNQQTRPQVSRAAKKVRDNTVGQIDVDGVQSKLLNKRNAEHLGVSSKTGKELHKNMQDSYLNKATLQQSTRAAGSAAIITAVTAGCINSFQCIQSLKNGEISLQQASQRILQDTVIAAGDSALKAGTATASVSLAARKLPELFAGSAFQSSLATGAIAGTAICAVDLVQCIVLCAAGKMTAEEVETRTGTNIFQTGAAVVGASVGGSIGTAGGPIGILVGSLVGGMITSLAMSIALDNHIESNFRLTLTTTEQVVSNGVTVHESLKFLQLAQEYYSEFHKGLYLSERHFERQNKTMQAQSLRLKSKIDRL
ncbi:hypothetical protein [Marinobacter sp.]|uniref:hypothetical protein n=1 Tax=Marinobacter sp. TaxID=50741 RepID=UPI003A9181F0